MLHPLIAGSGAGIADVTHDDEAQHRPVQVSLSGTVTDADTIGELLTQIIGLQSSEGYGLFSSSLCSTTFPSSFFPLPVCYWSS